MTQAGTKWPGIERLAKRIAMICYEGTVISEAQEIFIKNTAEAELRRALEPLLD